MIYTEKVIRQSNYWYNDGLNRANIRDLSGAIVSLKRSLQYCRQNTNARNLLGLVYYGRGEVNEAIVEWILSKNFKPRDNVANYFIRNVQDSSNELKRINNNIKKYNQCLEYCQQDAEDLALIQLKKVLSEHTNFVKGYQLMALLCIRKGEYRKASQALKKAKKIDITDTITLYYMNELQELKGVRSNEDNESSITYMAGNDMVIQPTSPIFKESSSNITIWNILIGVVIGVALVTYLIQPTILENKAMKNADAIRQYSNQLDSQKAQINALKTELDEYRTQIDQNKLSESNQEELRLSYETLLKVKEQLSSQSTSNKDMAKTLSAVIPEILDEEGLAIYKELSNTIYEPINSEYYKNAKAAYEEKDYAIAIEELEEIMKLDKSYDSYQAMLLLANAYENEDNLIEAKKYWEQLVKDGENTEAANEAEIKLEDLKEQDPSEEPN